MFDFRIVGFIIISKRDYVFSMEYMLFLFIGKMYVCVCAAGVDTVEAYSALLETKLLSFSHQ